MRFERQHNAAGMLAVPTPSLSFISSTKPATHHFTIGPENYV
jgi:hypothetical protein